MVGIRVWEGDNMALNKLDFDKIDERLKSITEKAVEQIEVKTDLPPTIEQLEDNNKTYAIMAAILFIDIRKSTYLTENSQAKSMVKIYRAFMRMAVDCVRKNGGVTRQFLGDRIMGVFIDTKDENDEVTEKAVDKAINAARSLQTVIDYSLNKHLKNNVNGKIIDCGIGIDYGRVLVTKVGMYGVESDATKEDEVDCVWVGNTTNHASKYSDLASGGEIFISDSLYKGLSEDYKEVWTKSAKYKGSKLFQGYVTSAYYLDFTEELGHPVKVEDESTTGRDTSQQLADGIKEIEALQNKLMQRERELATSSENIKNRTESLNKKVSVLYTKLCDLIGGCFYVNDDIQKYGSEFLLTSISYLYEIGELRGKSRKTIMYENEIGLIDIYNELGMYSMAFEVMENMSDKSSWLLLKNETLKWASEHGRIWRLIYNIETRIENGEIRKDDFQEYLDELEAAE